MPVPLTAAIWSDAPSSAARSRRSDRRRDPRRIAGRRCSAMVSRRLDDETLQYLADHPALLTQLYEHDASVFAVFGGSLRVHAGRVVPPGGADAVGAVGGGRRRDAGRGRIVSRALLTPGRRPPRAISTTRSGARSRRARRSRSACGSSDPAARLEAIQALAVGRIAASFPQWQPARLPFTRQLVRSRLHAGARRGRSGRLAVVPRGAIVVERAFDERRTAAARGAARVAGGRSVRSMPPGWPKRSRRATCAAAASGSISSHSASGRSAAPIAAAVADVLSAIRAFPRYRMLMLTLERMGVRRAAVVRRGGAAGAAAVAARRAPAFVAPAQFQGALALIARMRACGRSTSPPAEALVDQSARACRSIRTGGTPAASRLDAARRFGPPFRVATTRQRAVPGAGGRARRRDQPAAPRSTGKGSGIGSIRRSPKSSGCGAFARSRQSASLDLALDLAGHLADSCRRPRLAAQ